MGQIPLGNFDQPRVSPQGPIGALDVGGLAAKGQGGQAIAQAVMGAGQTVAEIGHERKMQDEALARAKATNAAQQYQLNVSAVADDLGDQLLRGADYNKAGDMYGTALQNIPTPQVQGLSPATQEAFSGAITEAKMRGQQRLNTFVIKARRDDGQTQFAQAINLSGQAAALPGADVASVNKQLDQQGAFYAQHFGLDGSITSKAVDARKEANWTNQVAQRFNAGHDDITALTQLQDELTKEDGTYAGVLDPNKRNVLSARVASRIDSLQNKADHAGDKIDAQALRTLAQIDQQVSTGIPASIEQWSAWQDAMKVASPDRQQEFNDRVKDEQTTQAMLRMPIDQQAASLQQMQADLYTNGGSLHEINNFKRLQTAVQSNVKLLTESPLQFASARDGVDVPPLDFAALSDPGQAAKLGTQFQQRFATVQAYQKQYGHEVQTNVLMPQEAKMFSALLDKSPASMQTGILSTLKRIVGGDDVYNAIMKQIAPDQPVVSYAGNIAGTGRVAAVDASTGFMRADQVAQTMLYGQQLLAPIDKAATKFPMPSDGGAMGLRATWAGVVGDGFRGDGVSEGQAYQAYRAMYAGMAATAGKADGVLDEHMAQKAAMYTVGNTVTWNSKVVIPPYGMNTNVFKDAANLQWDKVKASVPGYENDDLDSFNLDRIGDGTYVASNGLTPIIDKSGHPVVIRIGAANVDQIENAAKTKAEKAKPHPFSGTIRIGEQGGQITPPTPDQTAGMR